MSPLDFSKRLPPPLPLKRTHVGSTRFMPKGDLCLKRQSGKPRDGDSIRSKFLREGAGGGCFFKKRPPPAFALRYTKKAPEPCEQRGFPTRPRGSVSVGSDVVIQVLRGTIAADPEGRSPDHERGGFGIVEALEFGLKARTACAVAGVQAGLLAEIADAEQ